MIMGFFNVLSWIGLFFFITYFGSLMVFSVILAFLEPRLVTPLITLVCDF